MKLVKVMGFIIMFIFISCQNETEKKALTHEELVKKGEYLVTIGGCNDCHSPKKFDTGMPVPDADRLLSGHPQNAKLPEIDPNQVGPGKWILMSEDATAFVGPWGISFAANLTPDDQTGTGLWTEEHFLNAMHTGKHMGMGRAILPPMPWFNLNHAKDEDLRAIFAYVKSLKPVKNLVPGPIPPDQLGKM
jgi:mono/diheme cytochrome c family protein